MKLNIGSPEINLDKKAQDRLGYNIRLVLDLCGRRSIHQLVADELNISPSRLSSILGREQGGVITPRFLEVAAEFSGLKNAPGYTQEWWSLERSQLDDKLQWASFGKYLGSAPAIEWLAGMQRQPCHFVPGAVVTQLLGRRRAYGRPARAGLDDDADTVGFVGERYGAMMTLQDGPVEASVRAGEAMAFLIHHERNSGQNTVCAIAPQISGKGALAVVEAVQPKPLRSGETVTHSLLLAAENGGDIIGEGSRFRDVHVFVFVAAEVPQPMQSLALREDFPLTVEFTRQLHATVDKALSRGRVCVSRFIFEARTR